MAWSIAGYGYAETRPLVKNLGHISPSAAINTAWPCSIRRWVRLETGFVKEAMPLLGHCCRNHLLSMQCQFIIYTQVGLVSGSTNYLSR
jgi:hypothetical protein